MYPTKLMRFFRDIFLLLSLFALSNKVYAQTCTDVIGYYPNWQWYDRAQLVKPLTIQYSKYSIINYAFFKPETNGSLSSTDAWADQNLLLGQINWSTTPTSYYPNTSIVSLAHNAGTKVLPSIGGWTLSNNFPSIAATPSKRTLFAHSCCDLIRTYQFDGIDIDWEYPGYTPNSGTMNDKQNYSVFLQEVRDSLTALGIQDNKNYMLTICVGASQQNMLNIEWNTIVNTVDIINLMSYDFFGSWDAVANHNAPLFKPLQGDATFNIDSAVTYLLNHYQVPSNKLAAGLAFYGRSAKTSTAPALFAPITGVDNITFGNDDGTPLYYNIVASQNLFTRHWDANAQVPYLLGNGALHTFVSFDDKESIALKANYVKNKNLRGVIIWEITGDYMETSPGSGVIAGTPLLDTLNAVFCNTTGIGCNPPSSVTAIPSMNGLSLSWPSAAATSYTVQYKQQSDTTWIQLTTTSTSIQLNGLLCNTAYHIKVQSVCTASTSLFGTMQTFTTASCTPVCNTPGTMTAIPSSASATINWQNTGAVLYMLQYKIQTDSIWTTVPCNTNTTVLNGLAASTNYAVRVQSVCTSVSSSFSSTTLFTTQGISSGACNYTAWNAAGVYLAGDTVQYNNTIYRAKYWTQNNIPASNYGNCCVWDYVMPCGGFTASTCFKPVWDSLVAYSGGNQVYWNGLIYQAQWWTLSQNPAGNSGPGAVWQLASPATCAIQLNLKAFIQGFYVPSGNMVMSDSLVVELHAADAANSYPLLAVFHGLLSQNGNMLCNFPASVNGSLCYIVLKHRNALQTWSANPVTMSSGTSYDFSTAANKAYGANQIEVAPGVFAIYSGDLNADENIDLLDLSLLDNDITLFQFGYVISDINGDGNVDLLDTPIVEDNVNAFIFSNHP